MLHQPLSLSATRIHREGMLSFASELTSDRSNPTAVTANALVLQEWLEGGSDGDDQRDRYAALQRAHTNRGRDRTPDDDPNALIAEARHYYAIFRAP